MGQLQFDAGRARSLEAVYLTPDVVAQRARVLDLLGPSVGERILDIGVGPGLLAYDLARLVGESGVVAGVDPSSAMIEAAAQRVRDLPHATMHVGDARALPFDDGAFDAAVSTQVYEYVDDMPRALDELRRVLAPRGRALILDTDWRSIVWHSSDAARMERVLSCWDDHLFNPHLPATLGPMLRKAGFIVRRVEILPMLAARWQPTSYPGGMFGMIHAYVREHGDRFGLGPDEIASWYEDQLNLIRRDEFFFSVNRYIFVADR